MRKRIACCLGAWMMASLLLSATASASPALNETLKQIFQSHAFEAKHFGPARWVDGGSAYTTVEPSSAFPNSAARDIIRYETASSKRTVLVSASQLIPSPDKKPLTLENYAWSQDNKRLLIYTNSKKVWRRNTRGDYWILDLDSGKLRKMGGSAPESSLMFAQLSPDGRSVAYVRANDIYLEDIDTGAIRPLTTDGSQTLINGTSDWVNEEELDIRDGFRWSPDGRSIAYWQFDTTGVGVYTLINDTAETYPVLKQYPYPQVGSTNSASRGGRGKDTGRSYALDAYTGRPAGKLYRQNGLGGKLHTTGSGISEPAAKQQPRSAGRGRDGKRSHHPRRYRPQVGGSDGLISVGRGRQELALVKRAGWMAALVQNRKRGRSAATAHPRVRGYH